MQELRLQKSNDIDITQSMKQTATKFLQAAGARLCVAICYLCLAYLFFLPGLNFQQWSVVNTERASMIVG